MEKIEESRLKEKIKEWKALGLFTLFVFGLPTTLALTNRFENEKEFESSNQFIYATVIEEKYNTYVGEEKKVGNISGSGVSIPLNMKLSNMGIVMGGGNFEYSIPAQKSDYLLKLRTKENKELSLSVFDASDVKKESLDSLISPGTKICFPRGNVTVPYGFSRIEDKETYFHEGVQVGSKRADRIVVLD